MAIYISQESTPGRHPAALAWEAFRTSHASVFNGSAEGRYLENRLSHAFQAGWDAAEQAVRQALTIPPK
jgi:hypothetical protein